MLAEPMHTFSGLNRMLTPLAKTTHTLLVFPHIFDNETTLDKWIQKFLGLSVVVFFPYWSGKAYKESESAVSVVQKPVDTCISSESIICIMHRHGMVFIRLSRSVCIQQRPRKKCVDRERTICFPQIPVKSCRGSVSAV